MDTKLLYQQSYNCNICNSFEPGDEYLFLQEECQQLHQNVKYGLIKQPTVGELQKTAKALHEIKVKNWLETEMVKLSNLRDRANEKGHRKQYP
ncbi:uncharacterized protein At5g08430-like [Cryptomeria japonica]|uniref:uncharacterized protein At5g08430-like n=1 Tax=Cryptomeria japonica TaxID=3369 RepID=UPI0027DA02F5|nr:uncharacterized protein At5g08430-like [Cryptomeria japonica]